MGFVKKIWKDRKSEFPGRRKLDMVAGSLDSGLIVDVSRNEGEVPEPGDAYSAKNMNDLEQRIADAFSSCVESAEVNKIVFVTALPQDAASHTDTMYVIPG